jgi:8-oxo-dGTP pyrophosphatase MutT (NUDIX family)
MVVLKEQKKARLRELKEEAGYVKVKVPPTPAVCGVVPGADRLTPGIIKKGRKFQSKVPFRRLVDNC